MKFSFPVILCSFIASLTIAQITNTASFIGAGDIQTNGSLSLMSSWTSQADSGTSEGGTFVNYSGFVNAFTFQESVDTDGDGLADEDDTDDDNDGINDFLEITGNEFSPPIPTNPLKVDTDDDGLSDSEEAALRLSPIDPASICKIVSFYKYSDILSAISVNTIKGHTYRIEFSDNIYPGAEWRDFCNTNIGFGTYISIYSTNGIHTFFDDYSNHSSGFASTNSMRFYRIKVSKPKE